MAEQTSYDAAEMAARLGAILESTDDAIVSVDLEGIVTWWNRAAEAVFGYTAEEIVGRSIRLLVPNDRAPEEDQLLGEIRHGRAIRHFETIRVRKDGVCIPVSLTISPIYGPDGGVTGASGISRDISERRRLEEDRAALLATLRDQAENLARLNDVGTLATSMLDRRAMVQAVIDAAVRLTGAQFGAFFYNVADETGESYRLYVLAGEPQEPFSRFPSPRNTRIFGPTFRGERVVRSDDITQDPGFGQNPPYNGLPAGHPPVRSYLAVPIKTRENEVLGGLFFGHGDPGRFREKHEQLAVGVAAWASIALENARLFESVQAASRLKDEFLANLSHELRTPLNAILGYARMVRAGWLSSEKAANAVDTIERNASVLSRIIEDVLDVSRIVAGQVRLNTAAVHLTEVVKDAVAVARPAAHAKGIDLHADVDEEMDTVWGDPERLQQVVWNLLSNAVKFTERGGRVDVRLARTGASIQVIVTDTGVGIPPSFIPMLFERFRQADASSTRRYGGLGLGLSIAKELAELHGGRIDAESPGEHRGATFRLTLPLTGESAAPPAWHASEPDRTVAVRHTGTAVTDLRGIRVIAIDDDPDGLELAREILVAAGADVRIATSAAEGLRLLRSAGADLLLVDLAMPEMDGFALIEAVRQSRDQNVRQVPAVALTAYARSQDRERARQSGFQLHLPKPIDPAVLVEAIAQLMGRSGDLRG